MPGQVVHGLGKDGLQLRTGLQHRGIDAHAAGGEGAILVAQSLGQLRVERVAVAVIRIHEQRQPAGAVDAQRLVRELGERRRAGQLGVLDGQAGDAGGLQFGDRAHDVERVAVAVIRIHEQRQPAGAVDAQRLVRELGERPCNLFRVAPGLDHAPEGVLQPKFAFNEDMHRVMRDEALLGKRRLHASPIGMANRDPVFGLSLQSLPGGARP